MGTSFFDGECLLSHKESRFTLIVLMVKCVLFDSGLKVPPRAFEGESLADPIQRTKIWFWHV